MSVAVVIAPLLSSITMLPWERAGSIPGTLQLKSRCSVLRSTFSVKFHVMQCGKKRSRHLPFATVTSLRMEVKSTDNFRDPPVYTVDWLYFKTMSFTRWSVAAKCNKLTQPVSLFNGKGVPLVNTIQIRNLDIRVFTSYTVKVGRVHRLLIRDPQKNAAFDSIDLVDLSDRSPSQITHTHTHTGILTHASLWRWPLISRFVTHVTITAFVLALLNLDVPYLFVLEAIDCICLLIDCPLIKLFMHTWNNIWNLSSFTRLLI